MIDKIIIKILKFIPIIILLIFTIPLTKFFVHKLTPQLGIYTIPSTREHRPITTTPLPEYDSVLILEIVGANKIDQNRNTELERAIEKIIDQYNQINIGPFSLRWFFKFNLDMIFKGVSLENSDGSKLEAELSDLKCEGKTYGIDSIIFSKKNVMFENFSQSIKESIEFLSNCLANINKENPTSLNPYNVREEYKLIAGSNLINYVIIFIVMILALFGLLPISREGYRFIKKGFNYFNT